MSNRRHGMVHWGGVRWLAVATLTLLMVPLSGTPVAVTRAAQPSTVAITLTPSVPSGLAVAGTPITWTASSADPNQNLAYQFSVAYRGFPAQVVRDFSPRSSFVWAPAAEGRYAITVAVKEIMSNTVPNGLGFGQGPISLGSVTSYQVTTPVNATTGAIISPLANPQVAEYRAPACPFGDRILAQFQPATGGTQWTSTLPQACVPLLTRPFYMAGLLANTTYLMRHVVFRGSTVVSVSAPQSFTTGTPPATVHFPALTVVQTPTVQSDTTERFVLYAHAALGSVNTADPLATDLTGRIVWYTVQPDLQSVWAVREGAGTTYLFGNDGQQPATGGLDVLRVMDLAGNAVQETNIGAINDQLMALYGGAVPLIWGLHHDALPLPNGDLAVLSFTEETPVFTTTPYLGDNLIVLDKSLRVVWAWDSFSHLNPARLPTLGDICGQQALGFLCPVPGGPSTVDWLHTNAITYSSLDNNIVLSIRSQDWVIKIAYENGAGDGHVIWHLGYGGDFTLIPANPADPFPWFSHQHNPNFLDAGDTMTLFDNGNTRCVGAATGTCNSRGQEYLLDEHTMVVTQTLNLDLGNYSFAVGTAQRLANGNFNFDSGAQGPPTSSFGQVIEKQRDGTTDYVMQMGAQLYRAWRLRSMYDETNPPCPTCAAGY